MQRARLALACLSLAACAGSTTPQRVEPSRQCSLHLAPRQDEPRLGPAGATRAAPVSQIVVHLQQDLAPLATLLEGRVPKRLAEGRFRIGPGGTVTYSVERGSLSVSVSRTALVVETPVHARAQACRGESCYASCEPEAIVRAEVPLMLRADYGFQPTRVSLRFARGCKIRALGGLLTIDVTPTLQGELEPQLASVARQIDRQLPNSRSELERRWLQISAPRELPLGGCFVVQPQGIVQGPVEPSTRLLQARFALLAKPELRTRCGETPLPSTLPALRGDSTLPDQGVIRLGMVTPLSNVARGFEAASPEQLSDHGLRIARAEVTARGSDVTAELTLSGGVCGLLTLQSGLDFSGEGQFVRLMNWSWPSSERERVSDVGLEPAALARTLARMPRLAPLLSVSAFRTVAPELIATLSQPPVSVTANISSAHAAGAAARGDDLVAWLEARGSLLVTPQ